MSALGAAGTDSERYDCIVVGGGHNGLVCAAYLARAGRSVLVLEAGAAVGGAAITRELAPGFQVSACAHLVPALPARMLEELQLPAHGFRIAAASSSTVALQEQGAHLLLDGETVSSLSDAHPAVPQDQGAYPRYMERMSRFASALRPVLQSIPPRLGTDAWADRRALLKIGWQLRRLGREDLRELLRIGGMCVYDLLREHFETPLLQGALGFDAVLGSNLGVRSPGSVFTLLYRMATASGGHSAGAFIQPYGGVGALSSALANAASAAGADIRVAARVERLLVREHQVMGVQLSSGEAIEAATVISSVDPKQTFLSLLGAEHLDAGFTRRVAQLRTRGLAAKVHLALDDVPPFRSLSAQQLAGRLLIAPSLDYLERAFNHSKYGEFSTAPALEITIPTINDPALAPTGRHVLSAVVQYAPYTLAERWEEGGPRFLSAVIETLERHAPGLRKLIRSAELLTPRDIEREFRITGGHWHHADLALDQFFMARPVPGAAQYRSPVQGLYLCGAGCHPGGGITGMAGRNAARQVLEQAA